ncbi:MAG: PIG-L family deacetylase [Verrucomicrobia bacterium]|nr:PIG-L family deacetylase [Verrucomicrobiota bacterium]
MIQAADFLTPGTRILVIAPHPDDESLGAGGLIQQALAAGAEVRVIFVTDGDNNPWPQRWLEWRWHIDGECRRRWGARRRAEALRAIEKLGLLKSQAEFFGFPDAEILPRWRKGDAAIMDKFTRTFADWPADVMIPPSPMDRHPDHQGAFHFAQEALRKLKQHPVIFSYLIHPGWLAVEPSECLLHLTREQQAVKLQAILCHETQTSLSRGRFSSYASPEEAFVAEPS